MVDLKGTLSRKMIHLHGKTKRFATSLVFPVDPNREGECRNCGACCKFLFKCPFLISDTNGSSKGICVIYELRPPQCRKYPRTKSEKVHEPCGYCFADEYCRKNITEY